MIADSGMPLHAYRAPKCTLNITLSVISNKLSSKQVIYVPNLNPTPTPQYIITPVIHRLLV